MVSTQNALAVILHVLVAPILQSPVTLLFILKNRLGLLNSQSNSGVQCPSALNVSLRLGAVTTLGTTDNPVPTLMPPTLSRVSLLTPVLKEKIVLLGLGGLTGLVGESSSFHGPPRRVMMRRCSLSRQRCFCSAVDGGSRGDMVWIVGRVGALDWRLKRDWRRDWRLFFGGDVGDVVGVVSVDSVWVSGDSGETTGVFSGSWICMVGMLVSIVRPKVGGIFAAVSLSVSSVGFEADVGLESCISTSSSCCDEEYDPTPLAPLGMW